MTQNFLSVYHILKTGSGQFLQPRQFNRSPGLAKIAPWCFARRDSFSAKAPGLLAGVTAPPPLTAYTRCTLSAIIRTSTRYKSSLTGLPRRSLAYGNSRFCIFKVTKPAHEHHLQAPSA